MLFGSKLTTILSFIYMLIFEQKSSKNKIFYSHYSTTLAKGFTSLTATTTKG
jgi:hypothetical protein